MVDLSLFEESIMESLPIVDWNAYIVRGVIPARFNAPVVTNPARLLFHPNPALGVR